MKLDSKKVLMSFGKKRTYWRSHDGLLTLHSLQYAYEHGEGWGGALSPVRSRKQSLTGFSTAVLSASTQFTFLFEEEMRSVCR